MSIRLLTFHNKLPLISVRVVRLIDRHQPETPKTSARVLGILPPKYAANRPIRSLGSGPGLFKTNFIPSQSKKHATLHASSSLTVGDPALLESIRSVWGWANNASNAGTMAKNGGVQARQGERFVPNVPWQGLPLSQSYNKLKPLHLIVAVPAYVYALRCHCRSWLLRSFPHKLLSE